MTSVRKEILTQAEAFSRMHGNVLDLIPVYADDFRRIIVEFESIHNGRPPTADELLWLESKLKGYDITRAIDG